MADKIARRGITVYIDGSEVKNSVQSITNEMKKLIREQSKLTIGSDEYVAHAKKIAHLKGIQQEHIAYTRKMAAEYDKTSKSVSGFFNKITGGFGKLGVGIAIGAAVAAGIRSWINEMIRFSSAVSELSAITGATGKDLDFLKNKAKSLGAQYGKSATEIVEAMKLVGSAKPELLENAAALADMTESVLVLSKASGMELGDTTKNLATIMNQFGLSAASANTIINTLAAGSKYGAVEVDYLGDAIGKVGAVAASAGLDLEQTVAVMELFGEKGIKAEIAGTGFKSLLVELQRDTKNYTNGVFDLNKAIDNNQSISNNNIALTEKFGKEYFSLAQILFQNKERFMELGEQVKGTNTAFEQYAITTDNLRGDMDKLTSSWSGFLLSLEDGQGPIANTFRNLIKWAKDSVDMLSQLSRSDEQNNKNSLQKNIQRNIDYLKSTMTTTNQMNVVNGQILKEKERLKKHNEKINSINAEINKEGSSDILQKQLADATKAANGTTAYINALGGLRKELSAPAITETKDTTITDAGGGSGSNSGEDKAGKAFKAKEDALISSATRRQIITDDMYRTLTMSDYLYEQMTLANTTDMLNEKLKLYAQNGKDTADIEKQLSEVRQKQFESNKKKAENQQKALDEVLKIKIEPTEETDVIDTESYTLAMRLQILEAFHARGLRSEEEYQKELAALLKGNQDEINAYLKDASLKQNQDRYDQGLIGEKQYYDTNRQIHAEYIDNKFAKEQQLASDISAVANAAADLSAAMQDAALMGIDNKYANELKAAKKAGKDTTALEEKIENEKKEVKKKYADVDFAITSAQIIASTASAIMNALKIPPPFGQILAGIVGASGIAQLAVANQQRQSIKNLWTGGFTGSGGKYEPKGVVHGNEFVANSDALANPNLLPVFNAIDQAQRMGTVRNLKPKDFKRALGQENTSAVSGVRQRPSDSGNAQVPVSTLTALNDALLKVHATNSALVSELEKGIEAKYKISGDDGVVKGIERYNKLIKIGQR